MKPSIRIRILSSNVRTLVLGLFLFLMFGWLFSEAITPLLRKDSADHIILTMQVLFFAALGAGGAVMVVSALLFLLIPTLHPAMRQMSRYGNTQEAITAIERQLGKATALPGHFVLTDDWLIRFGGLSVTVYKVCDLALVARSTSKVDGGTLLVLCDIYAHQARFKLDGFEITKIVTTIKERAPWAIYELDADGWRTWETQRASMIDEVKRRRDVPLDRAISGA
jgi:hypothetical protein